MSTTHRPSSSLARRSARTALIAAVVAAVAGGCGHVVRLADAGMTGGSDSSVPDAAPPTPDAGISCGGSSIPQSDAETCALRAFCQTIIRCQGGFDSVDQCVQYGAGGFAAFLHGSFAQYGAAIAAGKIQYSGTAAVKCLTAVEAESCSQDLGNEAACSAVFSGSSSPGAACYFGEECGADADCAGGGDASNNVCMQGTCQADATVGNSCAMSSCVPGAHCVSTSTMMATCQDGTTGSPCGGDSDCDKPYWCNSGQCAPDVADGAACTTDAACPGSEQCVNSTCGSVDMPGDPCHGTCYGGLYCKIPMGASTGTCAALPGLNQSCSDTMMCNHFDLFCNANAICAKRPGVNESCGPGDCMPGLFCTAAVNGSATGVCSSPLGNNQPCNASDQCQSGYCMLGSSQTGTCQPFTTCY